MCPSIRRGEPVTGWPAGAPPRAAVPPAPCSRRPAKPGVRLLASLGILTPSVLQKQENPPVVEP